MVHPMSQPWLDWRSFASFPHDGEDYLLIGPAVLCIGKWEFGRLVVAGIFVSEPESIFTHWAAVPRNIPA